MSSLILSTDERRETVESLHLAVRLLAEAYAQPYSWRWAIPAVHVAVQGMMILALKGTWSINVMKDGKGGLKLKKIHGRTARTKSEILDAQTRGHVYLEDEANLKVLDFLSLYEHAQDKKNMFFYSNSQPLKPLTGEPASIKRLHEQRNEFMHFEPKTRIIALQMWPPIVRDACRTMRFLGFECGNVMWESKEQEALVRQALQDLEAQANELDVLYRSVVGSN